ncbi:MAG: hypothetical protein HC882_05890 [Acidobacteria bacterium]|nr:hypothetical protein [Acidobacteriota bacterium]
MGATLVLFEPEVRLGGSDGRVGEEVTLARLDRMLRQELAGRGIEVASTGGSDRESALRAALLEIVERQKQRGRRLRAGDPVNVRQELPEAQRSGASSVMVVMLSRSGFATEDGGSLPIPPDRLEPLPDERNDYEIPRADALSRPPSVDLDLLVVDALSGDVRAHRRVTYPARSSGEIDEALPVLVREATRGVTR